MAVRKRGKRWRVVVEAGRDPVTGKRKRLSLTCATKQEAEREEARLKHQVATGLELEPARLTVGQYLERWLEAVRPNLRPATFRRYGQLLRHQVIPRIGHIVLPRLRPLHVQQLYAWLAERGRVDGKGGLAAKTILQLHRVLSQALAQAVRWQLIPRNVCQAVDAPSAGRPEIGALGPDGALRLLEEAEREDSAYGDAVILAVHTGLRLGELLGLRWEDVNLERGSIAVRRALQHLPGEGATFLEPKTARSRRSIPLGTTALAALRRVRRRQLQQKLALGPAYQDQGLVFASPTGTPIIPRSLERAFARIVARAGVGPLRFHDLRHTHATLLLARGVHPKIVSERLGHASIAITMDTYSHVLPGLQEEAIRDLDAWLSGRG